MIRVDREGPVTIVIIDRAEHRNAVDRDTAAALADAFRRVGLAGGPCAGASCVMRAAEVIGRELGWSSSQRFDAAREFIQESWAGRAPVLSHSGWAQEEMVQGAWRGLLH